jgi:hypothetical protein
MSGCNASDCGRPGRLYAAGIRCDEHKPRGTWTALGPPPTAHQAAKCPDCKTADLILGRDVCQACGVARILRGAA